MQDALVAIKDGGVPPPGVLPSFQEIKDTLGFNRYYKEEKQYQVVSHDVFFSLLIQICLASCFLITCYRFNIRKGISQGGVNSRMANGIICYHMLVSMAQVPPGMLCSCQTLAQSSRPYVK
jgi:hypothetical protein